MWNVSGSALAEDDGHGISQEHREGELAVKFPPSQWLSPNSNACECSCSGGKTLSAIHGEVFVVLKQFGII